MIARGGRRLDAVDAAIVQLVPLVLDDAWGALTAATQLREQGHDDAVLRRVRARVSWAMAERPSRIAERALATIDAALSLGPPPREGAPDLAAGPQR